MEKGIVVASYGTVHTETLKKTIEVIENNVKKKYGENNFERAFTSKRVCHKLKTEKNYLVFNHEEALNTLKNKGFNNIVTMSLHILDGVEYKKLNNKYGKISEPLLFAEEDYEKIVENVATVPGTDGDKMSKSYGNVINMFGSKKALKKIEMWRLFTVYLAESKNQCEPGRKLKKGLGCGRQPFLLLYSFPHSGTAE